MGCLGRISHDAGGRLGRVAAQDRHQSTIGTETVGIESCEQDALLGDGVQLDGNVLLRAHGWHEVAGKALHDDNQDVGIAIGSLRLQYWIGVLVALAHHILENLCRLGFIHEAILRCKVFLMGQ